MSCLRGYTLIYRSRVFCNIALVRVITEIGSLDENTYLVIWMLVPDLDETHPSLMELELLKIKCSMMLDVNHSPT